MRLPHETMGGTVVAGITLAVALFLLARFLVGAPGA
jgi:hypothetical protein